MRWVSESGQTLLIAVMILVALMISIPSIIFFNRLLGRAGTSSVKSNKALSTAQEGVSYAIHAISANGGACNAAEFITGGNLRQYTGSSGGVYTIDCVTGGALENYQVQATVRGSASAQPNTQDYRTIRAILSKKTVAVSLPQQLQAAVAFQFAHPFAPTDGLNVHWGPTALFDANGVANPWVLTGLMDTQRYPRKFSSGPINGTIARTANAETDNLEYWTNTSLGFPNVIQETGAGSYQAQAIASVDVLPAIAACPPGNCAAAPNSSGNFQSVGAVSTATFGGGFGVGFSPTDVIYIDGNAQWDNINLDLRNGAVIVTGNLILGIPGAGIDLSLRVPPTVNLEYPYFPAARACSGTAPGGSCLSSTTGYGRVHFRGFLYVKGNLIVTNPGWVIDGVVRVDGTVTLPAGPASQLAIFYDDQINRSILTTSVELIVDSQTVVSAH